MERFLVMFICQTTVLSLCSHKRNIYYYYYWLISIFRVDIKAKSTITFKIGFRPEVDNQFYSSEIEFVCYFKSMRTFRLVTDKVRMFN